MKLFSLKSDKLPWAREYESILKMLMFQELPDSLAIIIYDFRGMKDEFNTVLDELKTRYDDGKWWCYRHWPQRPMRNTRKEPFPDRYGRRRAVRFTTDEDVLVSKQYWRKRRTLDALTAVTWGRSLAAQMVDNLQQHKYNYTTWLWLKSVDHEASSKYFNWIVKPYHDQHRDLIYMFDSYVL